MLKIFLNNKVWMFDTSKRNSHVITAGALWLPRLASLFPASSHSPFFSSAVTEQKTSSSLTSLIRFPSSLLIKAAAVGLTSLKGSPTSLVFLEKGV